MRFAEIFKTELFSKYGQKAGCYINEIYDIVSFSKKVKILDKKLENNLSKSIIRFTVRDYFLRNSSMDLHGEAQSLMNQFFAGSTRKNIQMNMAKKRLSNKDRT